MPSGQRNTKSKQRKKPNKNAVLRQKTYVSWYNMLARCYNAGHVSFSEYGGRGIQVHEAWRPTEGGLSFKEAFANFVRDVGIKPTRKHTLDRIKPDRHYTPDNVRWATPKEQGVNKRNTHFVRHPKTGQRIAAAILADEIQISYQQLRARMMKEGTWYELTLGEVIQGKQKPTEDPLPKA